MATRLRPDTATAIGARLRLIRLAYGVVQRREKPISQAELSRLCGIGAAAWNNAETGDNCIGIDAAMSLARRTGVTLDYIYLGKLGCVPHALAVEIEKINKSDASSS